MTTQLTPRQERVLAKLRQAKSEGMDLFLTGADKRTALTLIRKGLVKHGVQHGITVQVRFVAV